MRDGLRDVLERPLQEQAGMNIYAKAMRLPFLTGSLLPVVLAGALSYLHGSFRFLPLVIVLIGVGALHLGANLINDYYDDPGSDRINLHPTPFSGGSRVIQEELMAARTVWAMAMGFFLLGTAAGVWLALTGRPFVIVIGLLGFLSGYLYSAAPVNFMSRGLGEMTIFMAFGPLITWGTYYVMTGLLTWQAFALGIPLGFLITAVIWINQFPDCEADRRAGKRNWVVRLGRDRSRIIYLVLMLGPYAVILYWIFAWKDSWLYLAVLLTMPLALKAIKILNAHYQTYDEIIPAQALTIQTHMALGLVMSGVLVAHKLVF
jgi:1,4-dihydroxy-2-naphthoate octaprenyltransferase